MQPALCIRQNKDAPVTYPEDHAMVRRLYLVSGEPEVNPDRPSIYAWPGLPQTKHKPALRRGRLKGEVLDFLRTVKNLS